MKGRGPQQVCTSAVGLARNKLADRGIINCTGSKPARSGNKIRCLMFNAQSIRSKFDEFRCYIAIEMPDIICITETWTSENFCGDRLQDFELQGYNMFSYCRELRQGGGVLLYVNSLFCALRVDDPLKSKIAESVWIDVRIASVNKSKLRIGAFYRPGNLLKIPQMEAD